MTIEELESALGPRGQVFVKAGDNRRLVRKWLTANGIPSAVVQGLTLRQLASAYNDETNGALEALRTWQAPGVPADADDEADDAPAVRSDGGLESAILNLVQGRVKAGLDESSVRTIIDERIAELGGLKPVRIEVAIADRPAVEMATQHPAFERVLKLVCAGANVLLVGPAGCGKTRLCEALATATAREFAYVSGSAGASESILTGWLLPADGGRFEYQPSEFVRLYEKGGAVLLLDELDGFDSNMLLTANAMLANGHFSVPQRREAPIVRRGPDVAIVASANTYGHGADRIYAGRNQLDAATLDRFIIVEMDYDRGIESRLGTAGGLTPSEMADLWALRDRVREARLSRVVSTRAFEKAVKSKAAGDSWKETTRTLLSGWTRDELAKVAPEAVR